MAGTSARRKKSFVDKIDLGIHPRMDIVYANLE